MRQEVADRLPFLGRLRALALLLLPPLLLGAGTPPRQLSPVAAPQGHRQCAVCHGTHQKTGPSKKGQSPLGDALCDRCHLAGSQEPLAQEKLRLSARSQIGSSHLVDPLNPPRAGSYARVVREGGRTQVLENSCLGCHDAHARTPGKLRGEAFDTRGKLTGRKSASVADVCFGCHAGPDAVRLGSAASDLGALFGPGAGSAHRINASASDRPDLPSLRSMAFRGRLDCTSCHDNPDPAGPRGPHASRYPDLLKAPYGREQFGQRAGASANDLCYTCHDKYSIAANQSFPLHVQHIQGFSGRRGPDPARGLPGWGMAPAAIGLRSPRDLMPGRTPMALASFDEPATCATCHDPHGSATNPSLIQFDPMVVTPSSVGGIRFQRTGLGRGSCTLSCHGYDHIQTRY